MNTHRPPKGKRRTRIGITVRMHFFGQLNGCVDDFCGKDKNMILGKKYVKRDRRTGRNRIRERREMVVTRGSALTDLHSRDLLGESKAFFSFG